MLVRDLCLSLFYGQDPIHRNRREHHPITNLLGINLKKIHCVLQKRTSKTVLFALSLAVWSGEIRKMATALTRMRITQDWAGLHRRVNLSGSRSRPLAWERFHRTAWCSGEEVCCGDDEIGPCIFRRRRYGNGGTSGHHGHAKLAFPIPASFWIPPRSSQMLEATDGSVD